MDDAQHAANEEGKSSAGDKYETGRAMAQIERDKAAQQLNEATKLKGILDHLSLDAQHEKIGLGSLVITNKNKIFLCIGIGKVMLNENEFLVVAPGAPLGQALMGLKLNDKLVFNKEKITIVKIL
ncbi:3-oxoacyl-ACP synthase [Chryseolinea sp. H1M3-3]|uniref:3-oxoacyl-ACP synthase n=1 Tax=Chryseolinea sp. H1M3-3 TaxID=3034144 RepID=UPI0023ED0AE1|nr:3-oxoacyl-ACP synthase [Chryseolinea sp. H1M3-3]